MSLEVTDCNRMLYHLAIETYVHCRRIARSCWQVFGLLTANASPTLNTWLQPDTMPDVEMKPAETKPKEQEKKDNQEKPTPPTPAAEIKSNLALIERAVSTLEPRFTHRVLRTLSTLRKRIDASVLGQAIEEAYVTGLF